MFDMIPQLPLAEFAGQGDVQVQYHGVELSQLPVMEHFNVRLQPDDRELMDRLKHKLGFSFSLDPNTFVIHENVLCAWLGIDEWLVIAPMDKADVVEEKLSTVLAGQFATAVKLGSAQTVFRVSGERAVEFLSRGIAFDLTASVFRPGQCAQTVMAHTHVTVLNHSQNELSFDLIVRRSYADHLWRWLLDVGRGAKFHP